MTRMKFRRRREEAPEWVDRLAIYNAQVAQGLVHTEATRVEMAHLQAEYWRWLEAQAEACGYTVVRVEGV